MSDKIIRELWKIKDNIAQEHGYDIDALVAHLRGQRRPGNHRILDLQAIKKIAEQGGAVDQGHSGPIEK